MDRMTPLSEVAYRHIRAKLAHGVATELSEPVLAREIGISRTPIREAIRQLKSEGLLDPRANQGTFVCSPDRRDVDEIFQIRLLLEPHAARQAAQGMTKGDVRQIQRVQRDMLKVVERFAKAAGDAERLDILREHTMLDMRFHEIILQAAANRRICKMLGDAHLLTRSVGCPLATPGDMLPFLVKNQAQHGRVLRALKRRDGREAYQAMARHLRLARRNSLAFIDSVEMGSPVVSLWNAPAPRERQQAILQRKQRSRPGRPTQ
jgi:DNA-binding GntR family transcriptional regulator